MSDVRLGVERLIADPTLVPEKRLGLITNYTGVMPDLRPSREALVEAGVPVVALLSPEHGLEGIAQAGFAEGADVDRLTGLPVLDTYRLEGKDLEDKIAALEVDALVADIQDIGTRFYTYAWTVVDCMRAAASLDVPFYVLDRPNPLGGEVVEGPGLDLDFQSFVGRANVAIRHGMTLGELAITVAQAEGLPQPHVVQMGGWQRNMLWDDTGLLWVPPSPNLPTPQAALLYPGTALFEGTNMSEGRGTSLPFSQFGAPWLDESFADAILNEGLPGTAVRAAWFKPTFSKHEGEVVGGAEVYATDQGTYAPVENGVAYLRVAMGCGGENFAWRGFEGDTRPDGRAFIDLLWGSAALREGLAVGAAYQQVMESSPQPLKRHLLYE